MRPEETSPSLREAAEAWVAPARRCRLAIAATAWWMWAATHQKAASEAVGSRQNLVVCRLRPCWTMMLLRKSRWLAPWPFA